MQKRDPLPAFQKFCKENKLLKDADFASIDADIKAIVQEAVDFSEESPRPDMSQLLENVFSDPKGFGIAEDGAYRYTKPGFTSGQVEVS